MNVGELFILLGFEVDRNSMRSIDRAFGSIKTMVAAFATGAGMFGLGNMVKKAGEAAIHTKALSDQIGISTEAVQEWQYVAEQTGGSIDEIATGFTRFGVVLRAVQEGRNTMATRAFFRQGLTKKDAEEALASSEGFERAIYKVSDAFHKTGGTAGRAADSRLLFTRQSRSLITDMSKGADYIRQQKLDIRGRHAIVTAEETENLAEMGRQIHNVKTEWKHFVMQGIATLAPLLSRMMIGATNWLAHNRETIVSFVEMLMNVLVVGLNIVGAAVRGLAAAWEFLSSNTAEANIVIAAFGAYLSIRFLRYISAAITLMRTFGITSLIASAPLLIWVALVAVLAIAIYQLWDAFKETEAFQWLHDQLYDAEGNFVGFSQAVENIMSGLGDMIADAFTNAWQAIKDGFNQLLLDMGNAVGQFFKDHPILQGMADVGNLAVGGNDSMGMRDELEKIKATGSTAGTRWAETGAAASSTSNTNAPISQENNITMNFGNADPTTVKDAVGSALTVDELRHTAAALGVKTGK